MSATGVADARLNAGRPAGHYRAIALRTLRRAIPVLSLVMLAAWWWWLVQEPSLDRTFDAHAYWAVELRPGLYDQPVGERGAFLYSPAFAQLIAPAGLLPYQAFYALWTALNLVILVMLVRPTAAAALVLLPMSPVAEEVILGNVHLLLAGAIVLGMRHPSAWSLVVITKLSPGIGLLWYAARREWRAFAMGVGATLGIIGLSFLLASGLWFEWLGLLTANSGRDRIEFQFIHLSPVVRLPLAAAVVVVAARRGHAWAVPLGAFVALPVIWFHALSMLLAAVPLVPEERRAYATWLLVGALGVVGFLMLLTPEPH